MIRLHLAAPLVLLVALQGCSPSSSARPSVALLIVGSMGKTAGRMYQPRAIAVDPASGGFYVADRSGRILQYDGSGKPLREWFLPEYANGQPVGIALESDGNLLVNDSHYHRILRYSHDGTTLIGQWGTEGKGPGQFTFGRDIVVDRERFIYAGDYGGQNDRIQKFSRDGRFMLEWGGCGEEPGKFQRPQGMAVDPTGAEETILVADCSNHRVQRFTREGKWLSSLGRLGVGPGELRYPISVTVGADGTVYVCEWGNHRIQGFDASGRFRGFWGQAGRAPGELSHPWDVAVGPGGKIYVADCDNNRVQVFRWSLQGLALDAAGAPAESRHP